MALYAKEKAVKSRQWMRGENELLRPIDGCRPSAAEELVADLHQDQLRPNGVVLLIKVFGVVGALFLLTGAFISAVGWVAVP